MKVPTEFQDRILWYNPATWAAAGYAVPNWANNETTNNAGIADLVDAIGLNLSAALRTPQAYMRKPPDIGVLKAVHTMIIRAREIVGYRAVPPDKARFGGIHVMPAPQIFRVYPVPYFTIQNRWLKEWAMLALSCLSELMQNSENVESFDFSTNLGGMVGGYLQRIYSRMGVELLKIPAEKMDAKYVISDADWATYDPGKWFAPTEMIDVVPNLPAIPTEIQLGELARGIPVSHLASIGIWPEGAAETQAAATTTAAAGTGTPAPFPGQ